MSISQWKSVFAVVVFAIVTRILMFAGIDLYPDEAYYWYCSHRIAGGYFDFGPVVTLLAAPVNALAGELAFRFIFVVIGTLPIIFSALIARELTDEVDAPIWAALLCACAPMLVLAGGLAVTDPPHLAAYSATTWLFLRANGKTWLTTGFVCGLAILAKWNSVLLVPAAILSGVFDKTLREQLRKPWLYLGLLTGLLVVSPFLLWNSQHDWITFCFQFKHATTATSPNRLHSFVLYLVFLCAGAGPILIMLIPACYFQTFSSKRSAAWVRLSLATLFPLSVMAILAATGKVEHNWPAMCYPGGLAAVATFLSNRGRNARLAMGLSMILSVVLCLGFASELRNPTVLAANDSIQRAHGWREQVLALSEYKDRFVITSNYQIAAQLAYYGDFKRFGPTFQRASQFNIWNEQPGVADQEIVIVSFRPLTQPELFKFCVKPDKAKIVSAFFAGRLIRRLWVYLASCPSGRSSTQYNPGGKTRDVLK